MSKEIRFDDLARPVLNAGQQALLDSTCDLDVELSSESILAQAKQLAGVDDFGPMDFVERLDLACDEWNNDRGLTNFARLSSRNTLVMHATSRLLIQDRWNTHPEIFDEQIREPIIVVGMPRSGTTHLLNLLAADSRFRSLPLWEAFEPVARPGEPATCDSTDARWVRCQAAWEGLQQLSPHIAAMHPMNPEHIHEELELMGPDFASYNYEWLNHSPRWRDHYYAHDQTPHYEYMKNVLRLLQWQDRQRLGDAAANRRWVLKCPQHLEQLPVLTAVFPDATIAITHRDPVAVIQSAVMPLAYNQRVMRQTPMLQTLFEYWADRVEHLLRACVNDRPNLDSRRSVDVPFSEFMEDDLAMVRKIYAAAGLPMTTQSQQEQADFIETHPRGKHGRVIYNLQQDFGVDPAVLRQRFQFYFDAFAVEPEV